MDRISPEAVRATFRRLWGWWEWYVFLVGLLFFIAFAVHGSAKDAMTKMLASELSVIKTQNETSIRDREFLHGELKNTREELSSTKSALKRLERTVKTGEYP